MNYPEVSASPSTSLAGSKVSSREPALPCTGPVLGKGLEPSGDCGKPFRGVISSASAWPGSRREGLFQTPLPAWRNHVSSRVLFTASPLFLLLQPQKDQLGVVLP